MKKESRRVNFVKAFSKDYHVGALTRSSRYVARRIATYLEPEYKFIVEYGPGDGVITREILNHLSPDGQLLVIEANSAFLPTLHSIQDKRLVIVADNVQTMLLNFQNDSLPQPHVIISGIPFSFLKAKERRQIITTSAAVLEGGGLFIVYQYSLLVLPLLHDLFPVVKVSFEPRNLFPYFIMRAYKK